MRLTRFTRAFGIAILAVTLLLGPGCASHLVRPVADLSDFDHESGALVAFSIAPSTPVELQQIALLTGGDPQKSRTVRKISVQRNTGSRVYLFRVPRDGACFGPVRFSFDGLQWKTMELGPAFEPTLKSLTYLGRIETDEYQLKTYEDSGKAYPVAVKIRFIDASEEDVPLLAVRYRLPEAMPVVRAIPVTWGASEYAELIYRRPYRTFSEDRPYPMPVEVPAGRLGQNP